MKKKGVLLSALGAAAAVVVFAVFSFMHTPEGASVEDDADSGVARIADADAVDSRPQGIALVDDEAGGGSESADSEEEGVEETGEQTEEEKKADEEEKLVDAFDAETDRWMNMNSEKPPTMKEIDAFVAMFKKVPDGRKEECLQRALNLVSDENVMLLAGILMDKTLDKELIEQVYNDILNRDESVKDPILQQIYKDKEHPCWADTAWILDVTKENHGGDDAGEASDNGVDGESSEG